MLSFICGGAGCGKNDEIYRRAEADSSAGKNVFILVPEQYSMYAETELIMRLGLSAQRHIQIMTFSRLSNLILSKLGPLRMRYIDKAGRYILTRKAMQDTESKLSALKINMRQRGFSGLMMSAVSEFKRYGVTPDKLKTVSENIPDKKLGMKMSDLALVYERYNVLSEERYSDSEDNLSLIVPKISKCNFLKGTFYINFFRSFTPVEYDAISEIMKISDVCVSLCTNTLSAESDVFCSQVYTYSRLLSLAKERGIPVGDTAFLTEENCHEGSPYLKYLKNNFFEVCPKPMEGECDEINIIRPINPYSEVTECAKTIVRLVRTRGYSFNDFLILTGNMECYDRLIPPIFEEFGIKYFLDKKLSLSESPFMRMIISVLEILAYGFSYERLMTVIRSGYLNIPREDADILENYLLAANIRFGGFTGREDWTYNPSKKDFDMETVNRAKAAAIHPILDLVESFHGRKTVEDICRTLYKWLKDIKMPETVGEKTEHFKADKNIELAEQLRLVWGSFISVTSQMSECLGGTYVTFAEFYELFTSACTELTVGMVPPTKDKVMISEIERFRSTGVKIVMALGTNDGVFPRGRFSEGIISDTERALLKESGLELAPDSFTRQREEQFLIYSVLSTPTEGLYIFSPLGNNEGKSLGGSELVSRIKTMLPNVKVRGALTEEDGDYIEGREHIFRELTGRLFERERTNSRLDEPWQAAYEYFKSDSGYSERLRKIKKVFAAATNNKPISRKTAEKLYGRELVMSVSKLEKYNSCAFAFFMQYGLLARERLTGEFKNSDMGSVLHSILCSYFKDKSEKNTDFESISLSECRDEIAALTEKAAREQSEVLYEASSYYKYMVMRMKDIAAATAWKLIGFYSQSEFSPKGFEVKFGKGCSIPPYVIDFDDKRVLLEGTVDRIDTAKVGNKDYFVITDYKSSEKTLNMKLVSMGVTVQPLIYAGVMRSCLKTADAAAMLYLQMNDPIVKSDDEPEPDELYIARGNQIKATGLVLDNDLVINSLDKAYKQRGAIKYIPSGKDTALTAEELNQRIDEALGCAARTAEKILSGGTDINPVVGFGHDACSFCPYGSICGENK